MSAAVNWWQSISSGVGSTAICGFPLDAVRQQEIIWPERSGTQTPGDGLRVPDENGKASCRPVSDDQLVDRSLRGESNAFGELVARHFNMCLKRAILMLRNRGDAEDEVQNAFWKAFQHLEQYRGDGTFPAWLGRIVENQCLMRMREENRSHFLHLDEPTSANVKFELIGGFAGPEDELGEEQVADLVRREIARIPPLLRSVMVLRDVLQLPMPEVALRLGLTVPAAKSRLRRARTELRVRVARHCGLRGCASLTRRSQYGQLAYCRAS